MIYAFRFCQAQQWQCDVSEYTLPSSLSLRPLLAPRTSPPFALCAVPSHPDEGYLARSSLFHLALRHSHSGISSSSGRFLAVAVRPCNAAGTTVEPCPPPPPLAPSSTLPRAGATLPLLHRCSCNSNGRGRGGSNGRRTPSQRQRGNYEVVAAALVHLVVRGRDIGLPRSTLPVRYSFPASLMHYTRLSASALCRCPSPVRALRFSLGASIVSASLVVPPSSPSSPLFYVSQYFPFNLSSFSSIFPGPSRSCRLTRRAMFLSRSLRLRLSLSLSISQRGCDE